MARMKQDAPNSIVDIARTIALDLSGGRKAGRFRRLYNSDRIAFVADCMPSYWRSIASYQLEILEMFDRGASRVAIRGPHGLGKTFLASILVHHAVLTAMSDCKVPTTASAVRQLEKYLWPEIHKAASNLAWPVVGREPYEHGRELLRTTLRTRGGLVESFAVASDNYVSIEGAHATELSYVLDEAKTIPAGMWDAIEGAFSTEGLKQPNKRTIVPVNLSEESDNGRNDLGQTMMIEGPSQFKVNVFAISTPGPPVGRFYDIHMKKQGLEDWTVRHVTLAEAIAAGRVSAKWAEQRKRQWGEDSPVYLNRVLGEFADNAESGIVPLSWVRAAIERWKEWRDSGMSNSGRKVLGVDTARYGDDSTVFARRQGSVLEALFEFQKLPTTETAGNVVRYGHGGFHINIETDGGLGASVYDMLMDDYTELHNSMVAAELLHPITVGGATTFRDASGELGFVDVRSAMWWNMRELLDPNNGYDIALPDHPKLVEDLVSPQWETLRLGRIKLEEKKKIRKRIGRSTDFGDACCLAFWEGANTGGGIVF